MLSTVLLYSSLGFVGLVSQEIYPLYVLDDAEHGGFSLDSSSLGLLSFSAGPFLIVFQALLFERLVKSLGLLAVQRWSLLLFAAAALLGHLCGQSGSLHCLLHPGGQLWPAC